MTKTLKDHFSSIRNREEVITEIYNTPELLYTYESWTEVLQTQKSNAQDMPFQDKEVPATLQIY